MLVLDNSQPRIINSHIWEALHGKWSLPQLIHLSQKHMPYLNSTICHEHVKKIEESSHKKTREMQNYPTRMLDEMNCSELCDMLCQLKKEKEVLLIAWIKMTMQLTQCSKYSSLGLFFDRATWLTLCIWRKRSSHSRISPSYMTFQITLVKIYNTRIHTQRVWHHLSSSLTYFSFNRLQCGICRALVCELWQVTAKSEPSQKYLNI